MENNKKKKKLKKRYWVLICLAGILAVAVLLSYKPSGYEQLSGAGEIQVSQYITHELSATIYNGAQMQEPFELVVSQENTKDIVALSGWPKDYDGLILYAPQVRFEPGRMIVMAAVVIGGAEFVITIETEPGIDQNGLLNLRVDKVKIGVVNTTIAAKLIAEKIYRNQTAGRDIDVNDIEVKLAAALLNDEPFEPILLVEDKKVRIEKISIERGELTIKFVPAG